MALSCRKKDMKRDSMRERLWEETSGHCVYCGHPVTLGEMEVDHIVPKSIGGGGEYLNKVCCCPRCNDEKADLLVEDYLLEKMSDRKRHCYKNRLDTLVGQGRMSELKATMLYPLMEAEDRQMPPGFVQSLAKELFRLTEWQARRVLADILIGRAASMENDYGRKEEKQHDGYY